MKKTTPKQRNPQDAASRQPLQELRDALLALHKTLIDSERAVYEASVGPIDSPNHFFQLVSADPWFAWLRPVSQLIVAMDEALDAEGPLTSDSVDALMNESVFLLTRGKREGNSASAIWPLCSAIPMWFLPTRRWPSESVQRIRGHNATADIFVTRR